ncbi:large ribosomal subunit protein bL36m [Diretmus argenteus]
MAPLLLKHLTASLACRLAQMTRLSLSSSSPAASVYRCLSTLAAAPSRLLSSSAGVNFTQPLSSGFSAPCGTSLLGQCQRLPCIQPSAGMKTKSALKKRCKDCFIVRRRGRLFVFCKTHPRHKQRQG